MKRERVERGRKSFKFVTSAEFRCSLRAPARLELETDGCPMTAFPRLGLREIRRRILGLFSGIFATFSTLRRFFVLTS